MSSHASSGSANSSTTRPLRPPGTLVSDRGNLLSPLPSNIVLEAPGDLYKPVDCLSLPKPIAYGSAISPAQPLSSVLSSNPNSPENLSRGMLLSVVPHQQLSAASATKKPGRKPKGALRSNKSSFISRGVVFENFTKRLGDVRKIEDLSKSVVVVNYERSLNLLDFGAPTPQQKLEPLAKTFFAKAWPLCHEINLGTVGSQQIDIAVGTSAGDILWIELTSQRYARINKLGNVTHTPVTAVAWVPNSDSLVVAAHANGLVIIYDLYAEDSPEPPSAYQQRLMASMPQSSNKAYEVLLSLGESDANDLKQAVKAIYRLSNSSQQINKLIFLSSSKLLVASQNDYLKVFNLESETTTELVPSFFGGNNTCALSPDAQLLAVGGEDDMISIFETQRLHLVARLVGHVAWITSVTFDAYFDEPGAYKLASVGADGQICIWDFVPNIVGHHPRRHSALHSIPALRYGIDDHKLGGTATLVRARTPQYDATQVFPSSQTQPFLPEYGKSGLTDVTFTETQLLATSLDGRIYTWDKQRIRTQF